MNEAETIWRKHMVRLAANKIRTSEFQRNLAIASFPMQVAGIAKDLRELLMAEQAGIELSDDGQRKKEWLLDRILYQFATTFGRELIETEADVEA